jgi:hypothetical protein
MPAFQKPMAAIPTGTEWSREKTIIFLVDTTATGELAAISAAILTQWAEMSIVDSTPCK